MKILFYLTRTLYAKVLIPLIIKLVNNDHQIYVSGNRFINRSSFDFVAGISGYSGEWSNVKNKVRFALFYNPGVFDAIIGTTKNMEVLRALWAKYSQRKVFAVGYQHMPFIISLDGNFRHQNLPQDCMDTFVNENLFSKMHRFPEYISGNKISFRGFSYLEKVYADYYLEYIEKSRRVKRYVLVFHPGGYRGVVTEAGDRKSTSYEKQKRFLKSICTPILEQGLKPVIKIHPLAARYHFKKDVLDILHDISKDKGDFSKIIVEDTNYYKYVYESDTIISFGSSSIYELFSIQVRNVLICNFLGRERSRKFSFMKDIFVETIEDYNSFWKKKRDLYFSQAYKENPILNKIYNSYSALFEKDISGQILKDVGII